MPGDSVCSLRVFIKIILATKIFLLPFFNQMRIKNLYKFFDYFGLPTFLFLFVDSLVYVNQGIVDWRVVARLLVGFGGLLIDGYLVFFYRERKEKENAS